MVSDKNADVYIPSLNLNGIIRKKAHRCDALTHGFLCAKVTGNENNHIYMSFYHRLFIMCNLMSRIKSNIVVMNYQIFLFL